METNKKKYRWNITTFLTNILTIVMALTIIGMLITFFGAPYFNFTADALRDYMLSMSNILVIEFILQFILWLKNRFF